MNFRQWTCKNTSFGSVGCASMEPHLCADDDDDADDIDGKYGTGGPVKPFNLLHPTSEC